MVYWPVSYTDGWRGSPRHGQASYGALKRCKLDMKSETLC